MILSMLTNNSFGQNQIDFRGMGSIFVDFRVSKHTSIQTMLNGIMSNDFRELGFVFFDGGIKYRANKMISFNSNYRFLLKKNLNNFYDNRHLIYLDIDLSKSIHRWAISGTIRTQTEFYDRFYNGSRSPLVYNRSKINLKYRRNYFVHPFTELEIFCPVNHPTRRSIDQFRFSIGSTYTLNDRLRFEGFIQLRQQLQRNPNNSIFLIAFNSFINL